MFPSLFISSLTEPELGWNKVHGIHVYGLKGVSKIS